MRRGRGATPIGCCRSPTRRRRWVPRTSSGWRRPPTCSAATTSIARALERAHQAHLDAGEPLRAVRCAFWLGLTLMLRGEAGRATGWLGRAQRLLDRDGRDCVERGYLLIPVVCEHEVAGDYAGGLTPSRRPRRRSPSASATPTCSRSRCTSRATRWSSAGAGRRGPGAARRGDGRGRRRRALADRHRARVLQRDRRLPGGLRAAAGAGVDRSPRPGGARSSPTWSAFTGRCLVHRAEIMQLHGAWEDALREARRAGGRPARADEPGGRPGALPAGRAASPRRASSPRAEEAYRDASRCGARAAARPRAAAARPGQRRRRGGRDPPRRRPRRPSGSPACGCCRPTSRSCSPSGIAGAARSACARARAARAGLDERRCSARSSRTPAARSTSPPATPAARSSPSGAPARCGSELAGALRGGARARAGRAGVPCARRRGRGRARARRRPARCSRELRGGAGPRPRRRAVRRRRDRRHARADAARARGAAPGRGRRDQPGDRRRAGRSASGPSTGTSATSSPSSACPRAAAATAYAYEHELV